MRKLWICSQLLCKHPRYGLKTTTCERWDYQLFLSMNPGKGILSVNEPGKRDDQPIDQSPGKRRSAENMATVIDERSLAVRVESLLTPASGK